MKKLFTAVCRPSGMLRRMLAHQGDVSERDKPKPLAERVVLGARVRFFANGCHIVDGVEMDEQTSHDSEILRFCHASLLINGPVGDKKLCWVDARNDPVEVWVYGKPASVFVNIGKSAVQSGLCRVDELVESPPVEATGSIRRLIT